MENNKDKTILKLIDNDNSIEEFYKYIISKDFIVFQIFIFLLFTPPAFISYFDLKKSSTLSFITVILFLIIQSFLFYNKRKLDVMYGNTVKKSEIKRLKKIKDLSEKELIEILLKPLNENDLKIYLDKIIDDFNHKNYILDVLVEKCEIDIKKEYVIKSKYIKDILEVKSFYDDKTIIELFFENESYFKEYLSEIDFKTLKYEMVSENIDKYVSSKKSNYIEDIVDYLDEINLNDKSVYILKETLRIKNTAAPNNILNEVNNNMVSSF